MKIISEEIIEEDGQKYKIQEYDNGTIVKSIYYDKEENDNELTVEEMMLEIQVNTEYLICLNEINEE